MHKPILLLFFIGLCGLVLCVSLISCARSNHQQLTLTDNVDYIISNEMGRKVTKTLSSDDKHILCVKQESSLLVSFMVISQEGDIVIPKKKVRGTVAWHTAQSIEVTIIPGVVDKRSNELSITKSIISIKPKKEAI